MGLCDLCNSYHDVVGANDAAKRAAALAARVLRAGSPVLANVRENARVFAANLDNVLDRVRCADGSSPATLDRRTVQRAALALFARGTLSRSCVDDQRVPAGCSEQALQGERERLKHGRAAATIMREVARAQARFVTPCSGCGASNPEGAPAFKRCAACQAVAYCTRECQKAHWKKAHKRECATLAGAASAPSA
jgi:hypothetical protein